LRQQFPLASVNVKGRKRVSFGTTNTTNLPDNHR
jgi:hypothetical protein